MVVATDIKASLGRKQVLHGVDLCARPGEMTMIVGPNGSGKTTLLRALTGEISHTGRLSMNGQDITGLPVWRLAMSRAVLAQATTLAFPFTVVEVVRLGQMAGGSTARDQLALQALARVGLAGYEGRFYQELSGGEQQRVQLARVLCQVWEPVKDGVPRWLFLDEPVSALDIAHQIEVMNIARDFARAGGGVISVMHDLNLTGVYADQVVIMKNGAVLDAGPVGAVMTGDNLSCAYDCAVQPLMVADVNATIIHPARIVPHGASAVQSDHETPEMSAEGQNNAP